MTKKSKDVTGEIIQRPALSPEAREKQLVNLAVNLAEKQLQEGTASAAVITHFLKLGTKRAELESKLLDSQAKLVSAKADSVTSAKKNEQLAEAAIDAMKHYAGGSNADQH